MIESDVYVALGSNVEPERHIPAAISALDAAYEGLACSPAYRSAPVGFRGPDFINSVVRFRTRTALPELIRHFKALEVLAGRCKAQANVSRELDLDLILYGNAIVDTPALVIPRPDILHYAFVLRPLAELAPEVVHPQTGRTFAWHWTHFDGERIVLKPVKLVRID